METFLAPVEAKTGTGLPESVKDEFQAYLECGNLAHDSIFHVAGEAEVTKFRNHPALERYRDTQSTGALGTALSLSGS